jgi:hypothetical protein
MLVEHQQEAVMSRQQIEDLDLIWGVNGDDGIASFLNIPPSKAYYLIARGQIPVRKMGHRTIAASRNELRRLFSATASEDTVADRHQQQEVVTTV